MSFNHIINSLNSPLAILFITFQQSTKKRKKYLIVLRSVIEQRAQERHQRTTNNAIFNLFETFIFSSLGFFACDEGKSSAFPKTFPLQFSSIFFFFLQARSNILVWGMKRAVSAIKKALNVFFLFGKFLAFAEEKREGVYIKHLYSF